MNNFTPPDEFINYYSLDTIQENDFDFILDFADNLYEASVVCISFFDYKRFWYKSQEIHLAQTHTPSLNFPTDTISSTDHQIFTFNTTNHPFFTDLAIRSVTAIPLYLHSGKKVGFLSLWFKESYELSAKESKMLGVLAEKTIHLVEQKKQNRSELKFGKKQIQVLLDSTSSFIWGIDRDLKLISANKNYINTIQKYTGKTVKIGDAFFEEIFFSPDLVTFFEEQCERAFLGESFTEDAVVPATQWFKKQWFEVSFYPIFQAGEVINVLINARNITKRKKSKEQYELLFLSNPQPMWVYEKATFKFLEVNQAAIQHYGYSKEEFLKLSLYDIIHAEDVAQMVEQSEVNDLLQTNDLEWRHYKKNGEIIWVQLASHEIEYQNKKASHVLINDITEQKRHLTLLEEERANTIALINSTDDLVWSIDQDARLVIANEAYFNYVKTVTGYSIKPGDSDYVESFPAELNANRKKLNDRALAGETFAIEIHFPEVGKHWGTWSETRFNPIKEGDKVRGAAMFARNITSRKEIELALETNQRILLETSEVARVGGWEIDLVNQKISWSKITKEIHETALDFEPNFEDLINFHRLGHNQERIKRIFREVVATARDFDFETQILTAKGKERWVRVKGGVKTIEGKAVRMFGMVQDINDQKKHLEEIEMQNKQLREIAWMQSHVVRAPVARIMGIVSLFQDFDDLEISTNELFNNISDSAYEIDDIIRKINNTIQTNHKQVVQ
ncbi:PAS domain-containing protein [Arcicella rigui]|uniref:histidine kinase n=1 Tax=Arcicella rigui TaxID=797020 RepID=A0ABU5Q8Z1_9BACT|nr:PAS domain-containing protein [Arcicella rigui]MEA5139308.1 PAS domain-containing protein [Arcicella rigui]